ncbi:acyl-CoA N-acyltransferase [Melampsora americana]|nr:acyl-CoA N-acyltransferase [Melampsora americana]
MSLLRPFSALDLFKFNNVNLDPWTETYSVSYYLQYLTYWPSLINLTQSSNHSIMGYVMAKTEGNSSDWHGHISAITVSPSYRQLSLAKSMMNLIQKVSNLSNCFFIDLFVRVSNSIAIEFYERLGYSVYRRILGYYDGFDLVEQEDAFDMRKSLDADPDGLCVRSNGREVLVTDLF